MKKFIFLFVVSFLIISISQAQLDVSRTSNEQIQVDEPYTATLTTGPVTYSQFDIAELLPVGWNVLEWSVTGNSSAINFDHSTTSYLGSVREVYKWSFLEPAANGVVITYTAIPRHAGSFNITTLMTYSSPSGFESKENKIFVGGTTPGMMCGNNICESVYGESMLTCPNDCRFIKTMSPMVILSILILAMAIIFAGLAYREYKIYGPSWKKRRESVLDQPFVEEEEPQEEAPKETVFPVIESVKKAVERHVKKRLAKKPAKRHAKRAARGKEAVAGHTRFYNDMLSRLEKIRKTLK